MRQEAGFPTYEIKAKESKNYSSVGKSAFYYPIRYIEPFGPLSASDVGSDFASDPILVKSIERAVLSGETVLSMSSGGLAGQGDYFLFALFTPESPRY